MADLVTFLGTFHISFLILRCSAQATLHIPRQVKQDFAGGGQPRVRLLILIRLHHSDWNCLVRTFDRLCLWSLLSGIAVYGTSPAEGTPSTSVGGPGSAIAVWACCNNGASPRRSRPFADELRRRHSAKQWLAPVSVQFFHVALSLACFCLRSLSLSLAQAKGVGGSRARRDFSAASASTCGRHVLLGADLGA